ncbi:PREDICTED: disease resistance protein RPS2 [Theobroma cacao]|uniref:Disease resistance protein RPS2 n=1 Tax=Theobroma cacao TaxID=3641 RepID=A0AB32W8Q6_THECC|nr:PREDICTED: disease resistance protein RPS2 [Theobroma cacao]
MADNILASCLAGAVSQAGADLTNYAKSKVSLSQSMEKNYEMLRNEVARLQALRDDYEREVKKHKMKTTTSSYDVWRRCVNKTLENAKELEDRFEEDRRPSSRYIHVKRRSNYSGKLVKMYEEIQKLVEEGKFLGGILVDKPVDPVLKVHAPEIKGFPSLQRPLEQVLELLRNDKLKGIGICGTLGVGKTTIMQNLNNHDEVSKMFDIVIWENVSSERTEEKLQEDIARRLKLKMEGVVHPEDVARTISEELNNKKYLLLLDDVMDSVDLEDIGVPDNKNGSKVVLTTEFRHVCSSMADRLIEVHPLSSNEAWKMFQQMVSDVVDLPDIEPVAQLVAKECARLPLLIKTVAGAFKLKDSVPEWRKGLKDLRKWPEIEIPGLTELHSFLKFCYDQLKDDQKRKCFLYGALYPAESKIYTDYLLECWTAEGLVGNTNEKRRFQDARDEGYDTLKYLTNVSLLEKGERMIYVQMNNSIRQVALYISSQDPDCKFLTGMTENSPDCLEENDWQQAKRISMIDKKLRDLPESPNCNMLLSLLLQRNSNLSGIPQSFFENMKKLLVLDLYGTGIESLPSSLAKLTGLKGLYLNNCINVTELPPEIGELNCLEVLDIRGCRISFIPFHIQKLINLRCLRISYYRSSNLNHCQDMDIDCNVIPLLARLEELMIDVGSYDHWCNEVVEVMRQVATLENLTTLRICFPRSEVLKTFMQHSPSWKDRQQLTSFRFFVGCQNRKRPQILECFKYKINRYLGYCHGNYSDDSTICDLLAETDALELVEHKDIKSLTDFGNVASFNRIRGCLIERCNKMTTITDNNRTEGRDILPNLEQLHLVNLRSLQTILEGSLSTKSLSKLHTVVVTSCPMLTKVFSLRVIQQLSVLRKLAIQKCAKLEVLIEKPDSAGQVSPAFPNLETLILIEMPKLRTICVDKSLAWPSLKELQVYMCPELKSLPFDKDNAAYLKSIEAEQVWWEALHWPQNEVKEQLQSMCNLR